LPRHRKRKRSEPSKTPIWKRTDKHLAPKQRRIREKSLEVLSLVRREKLSLREASKRVGLDPQTARECTNAFRRVRGRWVAKSRDRIPRVMWIYEKGHRVAVEFADSRIASLIGEYYNLIKMFLDTGKSSFLKQMRRKKFKDIKGKTRTLETRPKAVLRIKQREPHPEYFQIYKG